ncbi:MAG: murein biosynthesis integral membrane protein MurJ [Anaerolineales bacterium]
MKRSAEAQIARGAGIVMAGFALSSLVGLLNRVLYSGVFGTGVSLDAFFSANRVPDILFSLIAGGALASAFIPTFATFLTQNDRTGAWHLASGIGNLLVLGLGLAAALVWITAPWIVPNLLVPGYDDPAQIELTVDLLRIQLIALVLFGISGLVMAILNAHQRFALPALAPAFNWLGWIIGIFLLVPRIGIYGLAWGVVLGALFHLLIQLPGLRGLRAHYTASLGTRDPAVRQVGKLMVPRVFGVAIVQLNFLVNIILASAMVEGSLTGITLAFAIMLMPQIVIAQAIAIAALPTFSAQVARGQISEMRESLATTLRGVVFLSLPASIGLLMLRRPIVSMLFERGEFNSRSTDLVAWALLWYAAGLVGHALVEIISRAFYALKDTRTPVLVGAAAMGLNLILSLSLSVGFERIGWEPLGGLALANTIATALEATVLLWLMRGRLNGLAFPRVRRGLFAAAAASVVLAVFLILWRDGTSGSSVWLVGLGGAVIGAAIYWLAALVFRAPEARGLPSLLRR